MTISPIPQPLAEVVSRDIKILREALLIAAHAKLNKIWECEYAIPALNRLESALKKLAALEAFAEKDEGMRLPDLGDDAKITLFWPDTDKENGMDCFVCHYHREDKKSIYAEGSSPRAAILAAIAQIPKQEEP